MPQRSLSRAMLLHNGTELMLYRLLRSLLNSNFASTLYKCVYISLVACSAAYADQHEVENEIVEDRANIAVFQEIPGFTEKLAQLDHETAYIDWERDWIAMRDADIWVFFLKDPLDGVMLPPFVHDYLAADYDGGSYYSYLTSVAIDGSTGPEDQRMYFTILSKFGDSSIEAIACEVASLVYHDLDTSGDFNRARSIESCRAG
jgi:hypothetical protein